MFIQFCCPFFNWVVLNFSLIPTIGIAGASLATCCSYIAVYSYRVIDTRKYVKLNILNKKHLIAFSILILTGFTMFVAGGLGQILLIVEFVFILFLFKEEWLPIVKMILKRGK